MKTTALLTGAAITLLCSACAQRPEWDQKKAEEIIRKCVALEKTGQPWDKIAWLTNPDQAIARARQEDKPILVFCFVKGNEGPAAAPC